MKEVLAPLVLSVVIVGLIVWFAFYIDRLSCEQYGEVTSKDVRYKALTGCYAQNSKDLTWESTNKIREVR